MFGSQAASSFRENKTKTQQDDFLYELPETMSDLELGDELTNALGTEAQNLFDQNAPQLKKKKKMKFLKIFWKNTK